MDGNTTCPRCQKKVYFAERRLYKGQYFHMVCSNKQQDEDLAGKRHFAIHEDQNCNPHDRVPINKAAYPATGCTIPAPAGLACTSCSAHLPDDCKFCSNCGTKVVIPEPQPVQRGPDPSQVCTGCGAGYAPDSRFCSGCGNRRP